MENANSIDFAPMWAILRKEYEEKVREEREKRERLEREKAEKREAKRREKAERREREKAERREAKEREETYLVAHKFGCTVQEYRILCNRYSSMKQRCGHRANQNCRQLKGYASRGIHICEEWLNNRDAFILWSVQNGFREDLELDRKDNDAGYSPDNCWFVTPSRNMRNTRRTLRLGDGTPFIDWYEAHVGTVYENGHSTTKYNRLVRAFHRGGMAEVLKILNKINGL